MITAGEMDILVSCMIDAGISEKQIDVVIMLRLGYDTYWKYKIGAYAPNEVIA